METISWGNVVTVGTQVLLTLESSVADRELVRAIPLLLGRAPFAITGLYICDEDLLLASDLPVTKEISFRGVVRRYDRRRLQQDFAAETERIRQAVAALAEEFGYNIRFDVAQGTHAIELNRAAQSMDFVIVTRPQWPGALRPRLVQPWFSTLDPEKSLLLVNEPWNSGTSVIAVYENTESEASVRLAARYAKAEKMKLVVVLLNGSELPDEDDWHDAERVRLEGQEQALAQLCESRDARLLVLSASGSTAWDRLVPELIDLVPCSILRLRRQFG